MTAPFAAAALGLGLGIITGMPLGVINVAIVDAVAAGEQRYAAGIAIGGALADTVHAALAFIGVGGVIAARPAWTGTLAVVAAATIVIYAVLAWRRRNRPAPAPIHKRNGVLVGAALTLPNPGALAAWVAVAAAIWPDVPRIDALIVAAGVGVGSATYFTMLARWLSKLRTDHRAMRVIPRVALGLMIAIAIAGIVRVVI